MSRTLEKRLLPWLAAVLIAAPSLEAAEPVVTNVIASQRADSKLVDIRYDLAYSGSDKVEVSVEISSDAGATFVVPADTLSGAVGRSASIVAGNGLQITWNAGADWNQRFTENAMVRIHAVEYTVVTGETPEGYVAIEGGTFTMGSPSGELGRYSDETQHEVTLSAFQMKVTEVTNQELIDVLNLAEDAGKLTVSASTVRNAEGSSQQELVDLDDSDCRIRWNAETDSFEMKDASYSDHPAVEVTWYGAVAWCNYLSDQTAGATRCYSFDDWSCNWSASGYRLPTESEWEYACRGETTRAYNDQTKNGGEGSDCLTTGSGTDSNLGTLAWYGANSGNSTHEVGGKQANGWGLFDMHGNVWEWCWDWYGTYPSGVQTNPKGSASGTDRVRRGGSWNNYARLCRSAYRSNSYPTDSHSSIGFRPVRSSVP